MTNKTYADHGPSGGNSGSDRGSAMWLGEQSPFSRHPKTQENEAQHLTNVGGTHRFGYSDGSDPSLRILHRGEVLHKADGGDQAVPPICWPSK